MTKDNEQERYKTLASIANTAWIVALVLTLGSLVLAIIFDWQFLDYIVKFSGVLIVLSLIIDSVLYIFEKNIKKIIYNILFIIVLVYIFFG
ncbi:hypothetical protein [Staphylococcus saprophyticus]|uniref:hypothetical protein n=1 Tax=Staphylococcus saprophyticus TaxID=29385 RepID=UPI001D179FAC|nr:hypothetical protein [Staphylococcus saprophyticus]MCC4220868.1 hypothetical protein [Staphylococcus saprophyticus]